MQGLKGNVRRQSELTVAPVVISVGKINSGVRNNIIPEEATLEGTIRTLDPAMQKETHARIRKVASTISNAYGATAEVDIDTKTLVTYNHPQLTELMVPALERAAGKENVRAKEWTTGAEDFSFFSDKVPGIFFFLGGMPANLQPKEAFPHHTPDFFIDDSKLDVGVKAFVELVFGYAALPVKPKM